MGDVEKSRTIEIQFSFIGETFYLAFRMAQFVQVLLPTLVWSAATKPLLWVFRIKDKGTKPGRDTVVKPESDQEAERQKPVEHCVDTDSWSHRVAWKLLNKLHDATSWTAGMCTDRLLYKRLLNWGLQIPVLAYEDHLETTIKYLGQRLSDQAREYNVFWVGKPRSIGRFRVVKKHIDADSKVVIECIWISGESAGTAFEIGPNFSRYKSWKDHRLPAHIYFPSRALVWLAEATLSATLLLAIIGLAEKSFPVLSNALKSGWHVVGVLWKFGAGLLHKILY